MSTTANVKLPVDLDNTFESVIGESPLVTGDASFHGVTEVVSHVSESRHPPKAWYVGMAISLSLLGLMGVMILYELFVGVGVWGNNQPVSWGFPIINFVFWVGIAHAGTLISAILLLFRQKWRTGINRFAEATTVFAVACAGIFPAIHVGRPWLAYWLAPYPNIMRDWPNFYSPLLWDALAVGTYTTVSVLFWYTGMIPDLATLRDRATGRIKQIAYGIFSLGWRGSARHWALLEKAVYLLAALATALVLGVSSTVSTDFAVSQIPAWHETIFPPYFTGGAIFSGFAVVLALAIPARELFGLKEVITKRHIDNLAKILLVMSSIVLYIYVIEYFIAYYSGSSFERFPYLNRLFGPYWWLGWGIMFCNGVVPQVFWFKWARNNPWLGVAVGILVNMGMWMERFTIIIISLHRDFVPSSWHMFVPTYVDICTFAGSFGLFFTLFLLFCRYIPMVAMYEVKSILPQAQVHHHEPTVVAGDAADASPQAGVAGVPTV